MDLEARINAFLDPVLLELGFRLVRVKLETNADLTLQLMVEPEDKTRMTIDGCAFISKSVSVILDAEAWMPENYSLEVSSPGLDRPLVSKEDFRRFVGFEVKVELTELQGGQKRFRGKLMGIQNESVKIITNSKEYVLPYSKILKSKLVITDQLLKSDRKG